MKTYRTFLTPETEKITAACIAGDSVCVLPNVLDFATGDIASFAGYPTGNHHQLVKASEARLAAQQGAQLIIVVPGITTETTLMTELVLLREAVPHPTTLAIVVDTQKLDDKQALELATIVAKSGADAICTGISKSRPSAHTALKNVLPIVAIGNTRDCAQDAMIWLHTD